MDAEELRQILEEGEGQRIEFKESLANLDKELVAFANASGGKIFIGITDGRKINGAKSLQQAQVSGPGCCQQLRPSSRDRTESLGCILIIVVKERERQALQVRPRVFPANGPELAEAQPQ